jgi:hypothetical protein
MGRFISPTHMKIILFLFISSVSYGGGGLIKLTQEFSGGIFNSNSGRSNSVTSFQDLGFVDKIYFSNENTLAFEVKDCASKFVRDCVAQVKFSNWEMAKAFKNKLESTNLPIQLLSQNWLTKPHCGYFSDNDYCQTLHFGIATMSQRNIKIKSLQDNVMQTATHAPLSLYWGVFHSIRWNAWS